MAAEKSGYSYLEAAGQARALNVVVKKSVYSNLGAGQVRALDRVMEKSGYSYLEAGDQAKALKIWIFQPSVIKG